MVLWAIWAFGCTIGCMDYSHFLRLQGENTSLEKAGNFNTQYRFDILLEMKLIGAAKRLNGKSQIVLL